MLVYCLECGARISSEAKYCPICGLPDAGRKSLEEDKKMDEQIERDIEEAGKQDEEKKKKK